MVNFCTIKIHFNCVTGKSTDVKLKVLHIIVCMCEEWATDEILFYSTLEGLRSSAVFRLDLTSSGSRITSVFEEMQPE